MTPMMRNVSLVVVAGVVLLVVAKLLGLFSVSVHPLQKPPIPTTKPTTWTITIHNVGGVIAYDPVVKFAPDKSQGGCTYATGTPDPRNLKVCQNDIVQWQATTSSGPKNSSLIVFMTDKFLENPPGTPVATFLGRDDNPTPQGTVDAPDTNPHEWYVVVIDKQNPDGSAHDDPIIKVGG